MENHEAVEYLSSLLGKQLRVHTTDTRMFVGEFKCTDNECNVILSRTYEYRQPSASALAATAIEGASGPVVKVDMASRFLGLVIVPGDAITMVELEESGYPASYGQNA